MKTYKSHKTVEAAEIRDVVHQMGADGYVLRLKGEHSELVSAEWVRKHAPGPQLKTLLGGYFVRYPDSYTSWSPAAAFEEGYTEHSLDPKDGALPVAGYKPQTSAAVETVNGNKAAEEATLRILDLLESYPGVDRRWLAIGRTHIEQGWMAVNRAVFQPGRAKLPDDE